MCCAVYNDIPPIIIDSIIDMDVLRSLLMSTMQAALFPLFLMHIMQIGDIANAAIAYNIYPWSIHILSSNMFSND